MAKDKFPSENVSPIIDGSYIGWIDRIVVFDGQLNEPNSLSIEFESCPNYQCLDGVKATGIRGEGILERK